MILVIPVLVNHPTRRSQLLLIGYLCQFHNPVQTTKKYRTVLSPIQCLKKYVQKEYCAVSKSRCCSSMSTTIQCLKKYVQNIYWAVSKSRCCSSMSCPPSFPNEWQSMVQWTGGRAGSLFRLMSCICICICICICCWGSLDDMLQFFFLLARKAGYCFSIWPCFICLMILEEIPHETDL